MVNNVLEQEMLQFIMVDALIRIRDYSGFFDSNNHKLKALLDVASNCEVQICHIVTEPDVILTLKNLHTSSSSPTKSRNSYQPFYREVIRVGLLLEKLALLLDSKARIEVDYPSKEELLGKNVQDFDSFLLEFYKNPIVIELSKEIPEELNDRVDSFLGLVIPPQNRMMGTCHWIWDMKKSIFRYGFKIDWEKPSEKFPDVIFD